MSQILYATIVSCYLKIKVHVIKELGLSMTPTTVHFFVQTKMSC
jgi:hypothetical protein